eukprot:1161466-Pelagomonas_calceolata.AAC.11
MTDLHCLHPCNASIHGWHALSHAQLHVHEPLPVAGMHSFARSCMCMSLDLSMSLYPWLACSQSCTAARASVPVPVQQTHRTALTVRREGFGRTLCNGALMALYTHWYN